jgi:hypothetical protein
VTSSNSRCEWALSPNLRDLSLEHIRPLGGGVGFVFGLDLVLAGHQR